MNLTLSKTDRTLWSTEQPKTIDHKLNIISELNVISAIQWKSKIVLASTGNMKRFHLGGSVERNNQEERH